MKNNSPFQLLTLVLSMMLALNVIGGRAVQAQTFQVIYNFTGGPDGGTPFAGLTVDDGGNLYGTTGHGGAGYGGVFSLNRAGSGFAFNSLYNFTGGTDGAGPYARVVFGPDGALYGSTVAGGQGACNYDGWIGCGTVFSLRPRATLCRTASCSWIEAVLYRFGGGSDAAVPQGDLIFDASKNIYGTTLSGGNGLGTIYELTPSGGQWTEQILYRAPGGNDGGYPYGGVVHDTSGNLYGVFAAYGSHGAGAVYQLTPSGSGWDENTVYGFTNENDGDVPECGLIMDQSGNLYGATTNAGIGGGGTVFEIMPSDNSWTYIVLQGFVGGVEDGPEAKLVMDADGSLYGTTVRDGEYGYGSVFKLTPVLGTWVHTSLHDFTGGDDGAYPYGNLVFDKSGNLYGTAAYGGTYGLGVVFEIPSN